MDYKQTDKEALERAIAELEKAAKMKNAPILDSAGFSEFWTKHPSLKWHQAMRKFHASKKGE